MRSVLNSIVGIVACAGTAALLSVFLSDSHGEIKLAGPIICLMAVIATSVLLGRLAGLFGSAAATLMLALFLFPPVGSFVVNDHSSRTVLLVTQFAAIFVVIVSPSAKSLGLSRRAMRSKSKR